MQHTLNKRISELQCQLPKQRQLLAAQAAAVSAAFSAKLSSPAALALAALSGALVVVWLRQNNTSNTENNHSIAALGYSAVLHGLWLSLWRTLRG